MVEKYEPIIIIIIFNNLMFSSTDFLNPWNLV